MFRLVGLIRTAQYALSVLCSLPNNYFYIVGYFYFRLNKKVGLLIIIFFFSYTDLHMGFYVLYKGLL